MSAYTQFGYPYATAASQLLVPGQTSSAGGATTSCCETGRVVATDPVTGAAICSCQYDSSRLSALKSYPRLSTGSTLHYSAAYAGGDPQSPYPSIGVDSGYFGSLGGAYGLKETGAADMGVYGGITSTPGYGYNPYDPSLYGYGAPYDLAARRKNATREATGTLKAWMNEHKKNPYPTKGEKIMLAIITKMTLTQISTWFANARRRLKKENKMTWEPKNKTDSDDDDTKADTKQENDTDKEDNEKDNAQNASGSEAFSPDASSEVKAEALSPSSQWKDKASLLDCGDALKPKIWSLADTAVCKTPPAGAAWSGETRYPCGDASGTTFPLPPTIGPGQIPRFSHLSQTKSMSQSHSQSHSQSQSHAQSQSHTQAQSLAQSQALPQAQAQARSQPQASPTDGHYQQPAPASSYRGAGGGGVSYGGMPTYGDTGTVTPPHTPPALNKSNMAKTAPSSAIHGYTGTYPGVLSALERRTETYPVQQLYRHQQQAQQLQQQAQQMQQHVADMSQHAARQHMPPDVNAYASAYKENAVASSSTEYISPMPGH